MKALILILALVSFNAMADGGDRQDKHDVNYWSGLDNAPHAHKRKNNLDDQYCWWKKVGGTWVDTCEYDKKSRGEYIQSHKPMPVTVSVPEPEIIGLLGVACLFFAVKKRKKA